MAYERLTLCIDARRANSWSKTFRMRTLALGLAVAFTSLPTLAADSDDKAAPPPPGPRGPHAPMHSMGPCTDDMPGHRMTGDMDRDFATMMRMHHQRGVAMARMELERGKSPELQAMSRKIIDAQQKEIRQLDEWLSKHP
ncbi:MAG TPA: DUF305 domain-containing protein [Burkholderiaceae bacterium]|nr:DUF305 domain-containing protein [Burkholderiaceae bacterium]